MWKATWFGLNQHQTKIRSQINRTFECANPYSAHDDNDDDDEGEDEEREDLVFVFVC